MPEAVGVSAVPEAAQELVPEAEDEAEAGTGTGAYYAAAVVATEVVAAAAAAAVIVVAGVAAAAAAAVVAAVVAASVEVLDPELLPVLRLRLQRHEQRHLPYEDGHGVVPFPVWRMVSAEPSA